MCKLSAFLLTLLAIGVRAEALPESSLAGRWEGQVLVEPGKMEVDFLLTIPNSASESGRIWFPTQGPTEQNVTILGVLKKDVAFETIDANGVVTNFSGELTAGDSRVEGSVLEQGVRQRFVMRRVPQQIAAWSKSRHVEVLTPDLKALRDEFNKESDRARILMVLAPSCGLCRMAARMMERYVSEIGDGVDGGKPPTTLIVWLLVSDSDTEESAREAAAARHGDAARQYWLAQPTLGELLRAPLNIKDALVWDVVLVFAPGTVWGDSIPQPAVFQHNRQNAAFPAEKLFNVPALMSEVRALLEKSGR